MAAARIIAVVLGSDWAGGPISVQQAVHLVLGGRQLGYGLHYDRTRRRHR